MENRLSDTRIFPWRLIGLAIAVIQAKIAFFQLDQNHDTWFLLSLNPEFLSTVDGGPPKFVSGPEEGFEVGFAQ